LAAWQLAGLSGEEDLGWGVGKGMEAAAGGSKPNKDAGSDGSGENDHRLLLNRNVFVFLCFYVFLV
jgi:hypothetical protein